MMLVVTYDVNTTTVLGQKRLRKVAKLCERYGMRVQNSVFEVLVNAAELVVLKAELEKIIAPKEDSVRFYRLGNSYEHKIETMGKQPLVQAGGALIFQGNSLRRSIRHIKMLRDWRRKMDTNYRYYGQKSKIDHENTI